MQQVLRYFNIMHLFMAYSDIKDQNIGDLNEHFDEKLLFLVIEHRKQKKVNDGDD